MPPLIRIEIEHMRQAIDVAFHEKMICLDNDFKAVLDEILEPEYLHRLLREKTREAFESAVRSEVRRYFDTGGQCHEAVKDMVYKYVAKALENPPD